jgi:hypothetical protein
VFHLNANLAFSDGDPAHDRFDDRALLFCGQVRPAGIKGLGFADDLVTREKLNLPEIDLCLQLGQLVVQLGKAHFQRSVTSIKALS